MRVSLGTVAAGVALVGSLAVAYLIITRGKKAAEAVGDVLGTVGAAVNPTNPNNVAARAVNAVVQTATGDEHATLGTKVWEWLNPGQRARESTITAPTGGGIVISRSALGATLDRDDAELGQQMRAFEYFNSVDRDDAELGAAMTAAQGPSLAYRLNVGRTK